jgi:hypothetical protein
MSKTLLPTALAPWSAWLNQMVPDLALELGEILKKINPLLGPLKGQNLGGPKTPEGLGNLMSRGSYERLISTEWLLADEWPEEFLRRAACGEHLFLAPEFQAHQAQQRMVVLFDAGPLQLGAPRLLHLALWILLARRAAAAKAQFLWGVLNEAGSWRTADSANALQNLLRARSFKQPQMAHWQTLVAEQKEALSECWIIGPTPPPAPWFTHQVHIERSVEADALEVHVKSATLTRSATLPLPTSAAALQLLRGDFDGESATPVQAKNTERFSLKRPPLIAFPGKGKKGFVVVPLLDKPGVMCIEIPAAAKQKRKSFQIRWPANSQPLALFFRNDKLSFLTVKEGQLCFFNFGKPIQVDLPSPDEFHAPVASANWLQATFIDPKWVVVLDRSRQLVVWTLSNDASPPAMRKLDEQVLCMAYRPGATLVFATHTEKTLRLHRYIVKDNQNFEKLDTETIYPPRGDVSRAFCVICENGGALAIQHSQENPSKGQVWSIYSFANKYEIKLLDSLNIASHTMPQLKKTIGLIYDKKTENFALLSLDSNSKKIWLHFPGDTTELIYAAPEAIVHCSISAGEKNFIALLTEKRELIVFDIKERAVRMSLSGELM